MSHDRKPGRVMVLKPGEGSPQRRKGDGRAPASAASAVGKPTMSGRARAMLIILFMLAAIGTAVAVELKLPS